MQNIVVIGAGGLGREIAAMLNTYFKDTFKVLGFVDDGIPAHEVINDMEVLGGVEWLLQQNELAVVFGIGAPGIKQTVQKRLSQNASLHYPNIMHPNARLHAPDLIQMGKGNVITDGCILTTNISIGSFNLFNLNTTIGHDVVTGDFCSIMPGVNISGGAQLRNLVYIGTGAKLIKASTLDEGCVVGAGAVVHSDVPAGQTFVGVPAKSI